MKTNLELFKPGKVYVVAVSGGVDSVVLLDILVENVVGSTFIVAHIDHGVRQDSNQDEALVRQLAGRYDLEYVSTSLELGPGVSEQLARQQRYEFLYSVATKYRAEAVVTAHHQDDIIETMLINLLRGTNRRGLSSLRSRSNLLRPLLEVTKQEICQYAQENDLAWREDSTNQDTAYLRNHIRQLVVPKMTETQKGDMLATYRQSLVLNEQIDGEVTNALADISTEQGLDRYALTMLPGEIARELLVQWLKSDSKDVEISQSLIRRIWLFIKTAKQGAQMDVGRKVKLLQSGESTQIVRG